jgi:hypothetical protein
MKSMSLIRSAVFAGSLLLGAVSAQAACSTCVATGPIIWEPDDPFATYSAVVKQRLWHQNSSGQWTSYDNYTTLTGDTMAYCQQQLNAVMGCPGVTVVQFCQKD